MVTTWYTRALHSCWLEDGRKLRRNYNVPLQMSGKAERDLKTRVRVTSVEHHSKGTERRCETIAT